MCDLGVGADHDGTGEDAHFELRSCVGTDMIATPLLGRDILLFEEGFEVVGHHLKISAHEKVLDPAFLKDLGALGGLSECAHTRGAPSGPKMQDSGLVFEDRFPLLGVLHTDQGKAWCRRSCGDLGLGLIEHAISKQREHSEDQKVDHGTTRIASSSLCCGGLLFVSIVSCCSSGFALGFGEGQRLGFFGWHGGSFVWEHGESRDPQAT